MSLLYSSLNNYTPIMDLDSSNLDSNDPDKLKETQIVQYQIKQEIQNYNYVRYQNGQLAFAILALVLLNSELID